MEATMDGVIQLCAMYCVQYERLCLASLTLWRPSTSLTTTTKLIDPNFTSLVTSSIDRSAWYLLENYGYSEGKAVSLSTFLPSMSPNTRQPYCTRSEDLISYSTRLSTTRPVGY